jgi:phosphatidylglycerol lysyltransferase
VQELGASFEVVNPAQTAELIPELKALSDQWLTHHAGGDKSFTMGGFDPRYVAEFPCALVRMEGAVVAFASLWTTPDQSSFSMDLMRYGDGAPKNVMDFLFVELLLWGQAQGYGAFELGMAPLAGLEERRLAPFLSRVGRLVFERGEDFYNFQGLRRYKDKYSPVWEPRYIAAPNKWSIPLLMADVGLLSSGGVAGLGRRPKRPAASEPAGSEPIGQNSPGVLGPARAGLLSTR